MVLVNTIRKQKKRINTIMNVDKDYINKDYVNKDYINKDYVNAHLPITKKLESIYSKSKQNITYINNIGKFKSTKTIKSKKHIMSGSKKGAQDFTLLRPKKDSDREWVYKYYKEEDDDTFNNDKKSIIQQITGSISKQTKDSKEGKKSSRCMCINYKDVNDFKSYDRCPRQALQNADFCELHQDCKSYLRNFLSGSEPEYQPEKWSDPYIEGSHNCYSYFLNRQVKAVKEKCESICKTKHKTCPQRDSECSDLKPQPGDFELIKRTGSDKDKERNYQCPSIQKKILLDNPSLLPIEFNAKCPNNYYKGAYVVDPNNTFHFYKQDKSGLWSHKPGISKIANKDASGRTIFAPHFADRNYEKDDDNDEAISYTNFCGYYCIPQNNITHKNLA